MRVFRTENQPVFCGKDVLKEWENIIEHIFPVFNEEKQGKIVLICSRSPCGSVD